MPIAFGVLFLGSLEQTGNVCMYVSVYMYMYTWIRVYVYRKALFMLTSSTSSLNSCAPVFNIEVVVSLPALERCPDGISLNVSRL